MQKRKATTKKVAPLNIPHRGIEKSVPRTSRAHHIISQVIVKSIVLSRKIRSPRNENREEMSFSILHYQHLCFISMHMAANAQLTDWIDGCLLARVCALVCSYVLYIDIKCVSNK